MRTGCLNTKKIQTFIKTEWISASDPDISLSNALFILQPVGTFTARYITVKTCIHYASLSIMFAKKSLPYNEVYQVHTFIPSAV